MRGSIHYAGTKGRGKNQRPYLVFSTEDAKLRKEIEKKVIEQLTTGVLIDFEYVKNNPGEAQFPESLEQALRLSINAENDAINLYQQLRDKYASTEEQRKVFDHIIEEEIQHKREFEELLAGKPVELVQNPISSEQGTHPKIKFICDKCQHTETFDIRKGATKDTFAKFLQAGGWKINTESGEVVCATCMGEFNDGE